MKKLLYLIPFLIIGNLWADSTTSGSVGFIKISTGIQDNQRHWGDKLNQNWDINAATITNIINGSIVLANTAHNPSSVTLQGNTVNISTVAGGINRVLVSSSSIWLPLDGSTSTKTGGLTVGGTVSATKLVGDGSALTNVVIAASTTNFVSNLFVSTQGTNSNQIYVSADEVDIMGSFFTSIATVCDISKTGVGGRGAASGDIASRMYSVWLIKNVSTVSLHAEEGYKTIPTDMPSGYTGWRKVADFFNDASANITPFKQRGARVTFMPAITLVNTASPSTTLARVNSNIYLSSAATTVHLYINGQEDIDQFKIQIGPLEYLGLMTSESSFHILANGVAGVQSSVVYLGVPLFESRDIKYAFPNTGTSLEIRLNGYENGGLGL